ncbi:hypothetical protein ACGFIK_18790 [Micromonospora sp. NPDC048871]|uniref:hypothetical protein n=1 Tax=unclassified Micromonospora TaxID=2617518 RepID=UPI002E1441A1|nr:hypothetical protein OIE53_06710 [Micromonospora sp. NBC_01739]
MVPLATVVMLCGCGLGIAQIDGDGRFRTPVREDEILPLPRSLRLVSADLCASGGSSGNCTAEFVVASSDAAGRETTVTRLVAHLRDTGWALQPERGSYSGSREVSGLLRWRPHRLWLYAEAEPAVVRQPATPHDAVNVHIDNL